MTHGQEQLSKNFLRSEFACNGKNCCGGSAPISERLVSALQDLRDLIGRPITIHSGFRCQVFNKRCKSNSTSQHTKGMAVDIKIPGMDPLDIVEHALRVDAFLGGGVGVYDRFLHVDVRHGRARWGF